MKKEGEGEGRKNAARHGERHGEKKRGEAKNDKIGEEKGEGNEEGRRRRGREDAARLGEKHGEKKSDEAEREKRVIGLGIVFVLSEMRLLRLHEWNVYTVSSYLAVIRRFNVFDFCVPLSPALHHKYGHASKIGV